MKLKKLFIGVLAIASIAACKKAPAPFMTLSEKSFTAVSDGETFTFDLSANVYYRVNVDQDWTTLTEVGKNGDVTTYQLVVKKNEDTVNDRYGEIRIIGDNVTPLKITIDQKRYIPMGVDPAEVSAKWDETSVRVNVCGTKPWTAEITGKGGAGWTLSQTSGETGAEVVVNFPQNLAEDDLKADLDVTFYDGTICSCTITHYGMPMGIDPKNIEVSYKATSTTASIIGQAAWTATVDKAGWAITPASGTGEMPVTITFPQNETTSAITGTVTVRMNNKDYKCTIKQNAAPQRIDLSANGTSNCYVISACGPYKFKSTVRGNGTEPASSAAEVPAAIAPKGAKVLWCTYNTATAPQSVDEIISNVKVVDGYVQFATTSEDAFTNANAIIAAYDNADCTGDIVWTWHIWLTDAPKDAVIGNNTWIDRHLGAITTADGDAGASGFFYQWGRKDPMRSAADYENKDFIATCPEPQGDEIEVNVSASTGTIAASIKNPRAFINTFPGGAGPKDWINDQGNTDRWGDAKTMFDPCPLGYKVPSNAQMIDLGNNSGFSPATDSHKGDEPYKAAYQAANHVFKTEVFSWPIAGYMAYNDGTKLTDVAVCCKLATSTWNKTANAFYFNGNGSACNFNNNATAGHASAVRCVKE